LRTAGLHLCFYNGMHVFSMSTGQWH